MTTRVIYLSNFRSYRAACNQVDEAIADIKRLTKERQQRIDALIASIERDTRDDVECRRPSDTEAPGVA